MEYKFTEIKEHPLRNCYMVIIKNSSIPPYFGTKAECLKARDFAERKAAEQFGSNNK